ncbi:UNVERIFIED_CONTAM: hypothetical protein FKN15_028252 [Acipenser sinensis]
MIEPQSKGLAGRQFPFNSKTTTNQYIWDMPVTAKNLGVTLDPCLSYSKHISTLVHTCRFFLSNIRRIKPFLINYSTQLLIQALVLSRLDYCNSLLAGLPASATHPLQLTQNSPARLVFSLPCFSHATPLLHSLHWLYLLYAPLPPKPAPSPPSPRSGGTTFLLMSGLPSP